MSKTFTIFYFYDQARDETTLELFRTLRRLIANEGRLSVADNVALTQVFDFYVLDSSVKSNELFMEEMEFVYRSLLGIRVD